MQCDETKTDDDEWRAVRHQAATASPFFGSGWRLAIKGEGTSFAHVRKWITRLRLLLFFCRSRGGAPRRGSRGEHRAARRVDQPGRVVHLKARAQKQNSTASSTGRAGASGEEAKTGGSGSAATKIKAARCSKPWLCVAAGVRCCAQIPLPFRLLSWNFNYEQPGGGACSLRATADEREPRGGAHLEIEWVSGARAERPARRRRDSQRGWERPTPGGERRSNQQQARGQRPGGMGMLGAGSRDRQEIYTCGGSSVPNPNPRRALVGWCRARALGARNSENPETETRTPLAVGSIFWHVQ